MTRTEWRDKTYALRDRIDSIPDQAHPAVRPLISQLNSLIGYGLEHEYISPREAAML